MLRVFKTQDSQVVQCMVTRGRTQFYLKASGARATSRFFQQTATLDNSYKSANDILLPHCLPLLQHIAPETTVRGLTVEDFLHSPTYHLDVIATDTPHGDIDILGADNCSEEVFHLLRCTPTASLPPKCEVVSHILASHVMLAPDREDLDSLGSLSGKVILTTSSEQLFFKPRENGREKEFDRELEILCRIRDFSIDVTELRVSELRGVVVSGPSGENTVGLVIALISPHKLGIHPLQKGFCGRFELHKQWEEQIHATLHNLHLRGIIWGDVNPCNIVIDKDLKAWIIDFGGNFNRTFVDEEKMESVAGDWQGLQRLFGDWLPSCRIWPTGEVGEINTANLY